MQSPQMRIKFVKALQFFLILGVTEVKDIPSMAEFSSRTTRIHAHDEDDNNYNNNKYN